jgi:hypothetical protein
MLRRTYVVSVASPGLESSLVEMQSEYHVEDLDVDERIILKWMLGKSGLSV